MMEQINLFSASKMESSIHNKEQKPKDICRRIKLNLISTCEI